MINKFLKKKNGSFDLKIYSSLISFIYLISTLAPDLCKMALPGHNEVLTKDQLTKACENYLEQCGNARLIGKFFSRTRARIILLGNSRLHLPGFMRHWIQH